MAERRGIGAVAGAVMLGVVATASASTTNTPTADALVSQSGVLPAQIVVEVPGCVVDPSDVIGWWRGEDDLTAAIGPDLVGTTGFAPGLIDRGIALDGNQIISIDGFPEIQGGVTVETWIKPNPTSSISALLSRWDFPSTDDAARSFALFLHPDGRLVWSTDETSTRRPEEPSVTAPQLFDGAFHHVAATWSAQRIAIYVDGIEVLDVPSQGGVLNPAASTQFRLGSKAGLGNPFFFSGVLDEPTVISRALTATEILGIVDAGPNAKCVDEPTLNVGPSAATTGGAARWKGANTGAEIFVGPLLPPSALPRSEANHLWSPGSTFDVTMTYDPIAATIMATSSGGSPTTVTYDFTADTSPTCPRQDWNTLDLLVVDSRTDAGLRLDGLEIDGVELGSVGTADVAGSPGAQAWHITGADIAQGFVPAGTIEIAGAGFVGNEGMRLQATAGCLAP
jgi:hypothetical protein